MLVLGSGYGVELVYFVSIMVKVTISLGLGLQLLFDHQAYLSCVTTCSFELPKGRSYNIHVSNQCIHTPLVSYILDHDVRLI